MASEDLSDPLFEISLRRWPPITRYKKKRSQETLTVESVPLSAEPAQHSLEANLVQQEATPVPEPAQSPLWPASPLPESISPVPLMNPYPIAFSPVVAVPPLHLSAFQHVGPSPSSTPSPSQGNLTYQQFGVAAAFPSFPLAHSFPAPGVPTPFPPLPQAVASSPAGPPVSSVMGGALGAAIRADFPSLHPLPWENVIRSPERDPTPPMHAPQVPSLSSLAARADGQGENFSDDTLKAIIIKAQPHHNNNSLSHLTRLQLVKHVDDLISWWKVANPLQANRVQQVNQAPIPQQQADPRSIVQARHDERLRAAGYPPMTAGVRAGVESAAASARSQEKTIGQCPCCCDSQQNAAFSPCGHLYACTRCAHRLYDGGRGKCPVCRGPIQTYLKIYPTG